MRAWEIQGSFGLDHLRLTDRPEPRPGPGQLTVRLTAASINYRDLLMVRGIYNPRQKLPLVPCSDGVGVVVELGPGVRRFAVGDRVSPIFSQSWLEGPPDRRAERTTLGGPLDGVMQEYLVVHEDSAVAVPEHLSDDEAACLPCAGVTAWRTVVTEGRVTAGDTVLTLGTGGVSLLAMQLARLQGARVIITSSSDDKLTRASELGAHHTINYRQVERWGKQAARIAGDRGVDLVVEVGGAGTLDESLRAVRVGGTVALIGVLAGARSDVALTRILMHSVRVQGIFVGNRADFEALNRALSLHTDVRPIVDRVFDFATLPKALRYLASGQHFGKVVVRAP
ncbi:MAG: NAD(P)-dependent alcohol dehydrogenase [Alphaproteobacteria bacterium]|nr:NAD(P)-dependent alcohol dehydrogenase [Alphaproteobacteria bacterium]